MTEHHISLRAVRDSVRSFLGGASKRKADMAASIISHLSSRETYNSSYLEEFKHFYRSSDTDRLLFFKAVSGCEQFIAFAIFNKLFALSDSPEILLELRKDLLRLLKTLKKSDPELAGGLKKLDGIFRNYLENIFNYQYLELEEHDADSTSINLLRFIAEKEGVHPEAHFADFEYRLNSPDRIILSLSHFKMRRLPLVYIEIALSGSVIRNISHILGRKHKILDPSKCSTAVFYSVNKCIGGLEGVKLGEKMILKSAEHLRAKFPRLKTFVTLSPVPSFTRYLKDLSAAKTDTAFFKGSKKEILKAETLAEDARLYLNREPGLKLKTPGDTLAFLTGDSKWISSRKNRDFLGPFIYELARQYLLHAKRQSHGGEVAYDPVENFHLNNGAQLKNINLFSNLSEKGLQESLGLMVNYLYDLGSVEKNRELYHSGRIVHHVRSL